MYIFDVGQEVYCNGDMKAYNNDVMIGKIVDVTVKDGNTIYIVEYHNSLIEGVGTFLGKDLELIEK